jgi:hypothetical protein
MLKWKRTLQGISLLPLIFRDSANSLNFYTFCVTYYLNAILKTHKQTKGMLNTDNSVILQISETAFSVKWWNFLWNFMKKFHENFHENVHELSRNFMKIHEIFHEISWNFFSLEKKIPSKVSWKWKISCNSMKFHECSWNSVSTGIYVGKRSEHLFVGMITI